MMKLLSKVITAVLVVTLHLSCHEEINSPVDSRIVKLKSEKYETYENTFQSIQLSKDARIEFVKINLPLATHIFKGQRTARAVYWEYNGKQEIQLVLFSSNQAIDEQEFDKFLIAAYKRFSGISTLSDIKLSGYLTLFNQDQEHIYTELWERGFQGPVHILGLPGEKKTALR